MNLTLFSDIHLEHFNACEIFDVGSGDILVLAGDILTAKHLKSDGYLKEVYLRFLSDCSKNYKHVIYVDGNHSFYGYNYEGSLKTIKEYLPENFHYLEQSKVTIGSYVFLGGIFWTDHNKENPLNMMENQCIMNDYKSIRITTNYRKLNPEDTAKVHKETKLYFEEQLDLHKDDKVIMVTHMAPSYQSVDPIYKEATYNSAYCSDLENWILERPQIHYWFHGHIHAPSDYMIGNCRVMCNPKGYPRQQTGYNPKFSLKI
jgi:Icc-related predicted phosphoesterase